MREKSTKDSSLRVAQEEFREMLASGVKEADWQAFFAKNPFIFSRALPIRVSPSQIIPMARPGESDPDFVFYQRSLGRIQGYGVIEIKRPDSRIVTLPRKDLVLLTREAATAVRQTEQYAESLNVERALVVGVPRHLFVIMGLSDELARVLASDILAPQIGRLAPGCQIVPFDELLRRFEATLPGATIVVVPRIGEVATAGPAAIALAILLDEIEVALHPSVPRSMVVPILERKREELQEFVADPRNLESNEPAREALLLLSIGPLTSGVVASIKTKLRRLAQKQKRWVLGSLRALLAANSRLEPDQLLSRFTNQQLLYLMISSFFEDTEQMASFLRLPYEKVQEEFYGAVNLSRQIGQEQRRDAGNTVPTGKR